MNDLILTATKAIKQCGYEPHIEGNEVYFYTPETEYVFSVELQGCKFWLSRIDMDTMPPFQMYKTVVWTKEAINNADIANLVLQIPTRNLSELRGEANFNFAKQKSDGSALNALNYFLCNPESKFSALSEEILSSFHFSGNYYVEVSNKTVKARYANGTLISTDDNKIFEIS